MLTAHINVGCNFLHTAITATVKSSELSMSQRLCTPRTMQYFDSLVSKIFYPGHE